MPQPRARMSQDRSRKRRDELIEAALDLFAEGGTRAVTHRAVAKKAGVPPATPAYYFETIDELLSAALEQYLLSWHHDIDGLVAFNVSVAALLDSEQMTRTISELYAMRPPSLLLRDIAIYAHSQHEPSLQELAAAAVNELDSGINSSVATVNPPRPDLLSFVFSTLIIGSAVRRAGKVNGDEYESRMLAETLKFTATAAISGALGPLPEPRRGNND